MAESKVTKIEVARRQLDAGIVMVFDEVDIVPVHTVLFAASELLKDLCEHAGKKSAFDQAAAEMIKPEYRTEVYHLTRKHALFFKHAHRDPGAEEELFAPEVNDFLVLSSLMRLQALEEKFSPKMSIFYYWLLWCNPRYWREAPGGTHAQLCRLLGSFSRAERLAFGRLLLTATSADDCEVARVIESIERRFPQAYASIVGATNEASELVGQR